MRIGFAPPQRVQAAQHVVADRYIDRAQLIEIERERMAVEGRRQGASDALNLAAFTVMRCSAKTSNRAKAWGASN